MKDHNGNIYKARMKGIFKIDEITSTNPVAVGDEVEFDIEKDHEKTAMISEIYQRKNYINRKAPSHRMHHHIVAANVDQCVLFATLKDPKTSQGFLDRFLVACEAYHVPAIIVFNKSDIYRDKELQKFETMKAMYEAIGYTVLLMSMQTEQGVSELKQLLKDKVSLISGHSGVGKGPGDAPAALPGGVVDSTPTSSAGPLSRSVYWRSRRSWFQRWDPQPMSAPMPNARSPPTPSIQ